MIKINCHLFSFFLLLFKKGKAHKHVNYDHYSFCYYFASSSKGKALCIRYSFLFIYLFHWYFTRKKKMVKYFLSIYNNSKIINNNRYYIEFKQVNIIIPKSKNKGFIHIYIQALDFIIFRITTTDESIELFLALQFSLLIRNRKRICRSIK